MVLQTNGGLYQEERPYLWARDMPVKLAQRIVNFIKTIFIARVEELKGKQNSSL